MKDKERRVIMKSVFDSMHDHLHDLYRVINGKCQSEDVDMMTGAELNTLFKARDYTVLLDATLKELEKILYSNKIAV
jgi:hypothetical protein